MFWRAGKRSLSALFGAVACLLPMAPQAEDQHATLDPAAYEPAPWPYERIPYNWGDANDRVYPDAAQLPFAMTGKLDDGYGEPCSFGLISPNVIATAAHCLILHWAVNKQDAQGPYYEGPTGIMAYAGYDRGDYVAAAEIVGYYYGPATVDGFNGSFESRDYAFAVLSEPIGYEVGQWFTVDGVDDAYIQRLIDNQAPIYQSGYALDYDGQTAHLGFRLTPPPPFVPAGNDLVVATDADIINGDSGSFAFTADDDQYRLLGIFHVIVGDPWPPNDQAFIVAAPRFKDEMQAYIEAHQAHPAPPRPDGPLPGRS